MTRLRILKNQETRRRDYASRHLAFSDAARWAGDLKGNAALITLGCAKNQVDSEIMLGVLQANGFQLVDDLALADVAIVNTCAFLQSAVTESIDCILDVAAFKKSGRLRRLIVSGCMVERYKEKLVEALPEVDAFIGTQQIPYVADAAKGDISAFLEQPAESNFLYDECMPRIWSTQSAYAFVKISEGCSRKCSFCIIPKLRGAMRCRSIESLKREVQQLAASGIKEINLIAQDSTAYRSETGEDIVSLLMELDALNAVNWIRLMYGFPAGINESLMRALVELPSLCEYLDIPLQHSSEKMLKRMRRPLGRFASRSLVDMMRKTAPVVALRSTFIVGYPGESEADIEDLENFVREGHFASVGVFAFSREEGTTSYDAAMQIDEAEKELRRERIMLAQQEVLKSKLSSYIGKDLEVLVEGLHEETDLLLSARTRFQAPEVDSKVLINQIEKENAAPQAGELGMVKITGVLGYDLVGTYKQLV